MRATLLLLVALVMVASPPRARARAWKAAPKGSGSGSTGKALAPKAATPRVAVKGSQAPVNAAAAESVLAVAMIPITATERRAQRVAARMTRQTFTRLRRSLNKQPGAKARLVAQKKGAPTSACLQQKSCLASLCKALSVTYLLGGSLVKVGRAYHLDLTIASCALGRVVDVRAMESPQRQLLKSVPKEAWAFVQGAPAAAREVRAAAVLERQRKAEEKALSDRLAKSDEDPVDPRRVINKPASQPVASAAPRGFFASVFSWRYWTGWLAMGLATGSLGAGIAFGAVSSSAVSDAEAAVLQVEAWRHRDKAQLNARAANVFFATAGALALTSVVIHLVQYKLSRGAAERKAASTWRWEPTIGGLTLRHSF